jgi:cell division protein ZapB
MRWLDFARAATKHTKKMEVLTQLTDKIETLIEKKETLEAENMLLRDQLDKERQNKEAVLAKIEHLLGRIQEVNLD